MAVPMLVSVMVDQKETIWREVVAPRQAARCLAAVRALVSGFLRRRLHGGVSHPATLQYGVHGKIIGGFCVFTHTIANEEVKVVITTQLSSPIRPLKIWFSGYCVRVVFNSGCFGHEWHAVVLEMTGGMAVPVVVLTDFFWYCEDCGVDACGQKKSRKV